VLAAAVWAERRGHRFERDLETLTATLFLVGRGGTEFIGAPTASRPSDVGCSWLRDLCLLTPRQDVRPGG
jgi:hypothetical protein